MKASPVRSAVVLAVLASTFAALGSLLGSAVAAAEPAGYWQSEAEQLPSATSDVGFPSFPIQLERADVAPSATGVEVTLTPYLAPWAHDLVPVDRDAAIDLRGAIALTAPGLRIDVAGHCIFAGDGTRDAPTHQIVSPVAIVGDEVNGLAISPTVYVR